MIARIIAEGSNYPKKLILFECTVDCVKLTTKEDLKYLKINLSLGWNNLRIFSQRNQNNYCFIVFLKSFKWSHEWDYLPIRRRTISLNANFMFNNLINDNWIRLQNSSHSATCHGRVYKGLNILYITLYCIRKYDKRRYIAYIRREWRSIEKCNLRSLWSRRCAAWSCRDRLAV